MRDRNREIEGGEAIKETRNRNRKTERGNKGGNEGRKH